MRLVLHIWRQESPSAVGAMQRYELPDVSPDESFLEMLDKLNERLVDAGEEPIAFDSDCREGICGMCSLVINGVPHGPDHGATVCQLHMRRFEDGDDVYIEPWRAGPFPVLRDLIVDRGAFDRIMAAGGYVSVNTGGAPDANALPVGKDEADTAMEAASCIGCGACVAACKNASAMLFVAAKVAHLAHLPQGEPESRRRVRSMVARMDAEGFGACTNLLECEGVCPKLVPARFISEMNRGFLLASLRGPT